jgi:copper transport protein
MTGGLGQGRSASESTTIAGIFEVLVRPIRQCVAAAVLVLAAVVVLAGPASAHTGFESSDPADGASIAEPVEIITLVFTGQAQPTGNGFEIFDSNGHLREPTNATTADGSTWVLRFDPPVAGGTIGFRWTVKAPDAHPIDGSFSFNVTAPTSSAVQDEPTVPDAGHPATPATGTDTDLEAFLDTSGDATATSRRVGAAGRLITLTGTLVGVGALVFAAAVLRGDPKDVRHVLHWVRRAGVLVVLGALVEFFAQLAVEGGGNSSAIWSLSALSAVVFSSFGVAVGLRVIGGISVSSGVRLNIAQATEAPDPVAAIRNLVGVGAARSGYPLAPEHRTGHRGRPRPASAPCTHDSDHAWLPTADSAGAMLGAAALLAAYLFDGHTVTKGNRLFTGVVDLVHVAGAAVWAGGVIMLATTLWRRRRQGRELRALELAVRFSVLATVALVAVGLAGLVLTVIIVDSPAELWTTEWGRLLIAKTAFVAIAAAAGGYNHMILIPEMLRFPNDNTLAQRFRAIVAGEAAALLAVLGITALLMGAAS